MFEIARATGPSAGLVGRRQWGWAANGTAHHGATVKTRLFTSIWKR